MKLLILAGGKGTRLGYKDIPKPMALVNGKPVLQYQIELAKNMELMKFLFCLDISHNQLLIILKMDLIGDFLLSI